MILKRQGEERQEVELVAPQDQETVAAEQTLPEPVCPDGSPVAEPTEPASKVPGNSPLDEILPELDQAQHEEPDEGEQGGAS